ncbi:bifunctional UDP-sugar hydrolase/5'-nucleotidase UshA [Shewanella corallii]|uniref:Bifunctional UDP-sugar hydrolase/5'-nucleotidase UshA n=1 Tax=Shewanella corallii TaxID=560080 RepID=A0ABT0NDM4_9GAMM|nr:bifunctional UDP-sugar hydrolase/5'-nucleotidase UshA [Shewanella corallii]MCL2916588.1 bifunctional UDP-sugar hydrolase/5'-nucleotidase UshA [Shewanella corallii]
MSVFSPRVAGTGLGLLIAALLGGCQSAPTPQNCAQAGDACVKFSLLHTNDHHGRFWRNKDDEYGMAARKTLVAQQRAEIKASGGASLLLSGGDINTGVPESDMQDAVPDFIGMNLIGYDAMAVGNHEFDNDLDVLNMQQELATFPMLAANIYRRDEHGLISAERYFEPYRIFDLNGVRIAVVGMTTKDTAHLVHPDNVASVYFADPITEMPKVLDEIKASGEQVDLVFALTHMGHYADGNHGSEAPGDVMMARTLPAGHLHGVIGGHSQNPVCMEPEGNRYADFKPGDDCLPDNQNGTWIMQAHEWGKYVGRADFGFYQGKLELLNYRLIPVNLKVKDALGNAVLAAAEIPEDADVLATLSPYQQTGQELLDKRIAQSTAFFDGERASVRSRQTNLGHLLGEAFRTHKLINADFAVVNSGGIRASLQQGEISYRDVLTVQPFGNFITRASMSGGELESYLGKLTGLTGGGFAQLSNIRLDVNCDAGSVDIHDIAGKGFSRDGQYTFAISGFSAAGGDGYPKINSVNMQQTDAEMLKAYLQSLGQVTDEGFSPENKVKYFSGGKQVFNCAAMP